MSGTLNVRWTSTRWCLKVFCKAFQESVNDRANYKWLSFYFTCICVPNKVLPLFVLIIKAIQFIFGKHCGCLHTTDISLPWSPHSMRTQRAGPPSPHPASPSSSPHRVQMMDPRRKSAEGFLKSFSSLIKFSNPIYLKCLNFTFILARKQNSRFPGLFFNFLLVFLHDVNPLLPVPIAPEKSGIISIISWTFPLHLSLHHSAFKVPLYIMHFQQTDYYVLKYGFLWIYFSKIVGFLNF